MPLKEFLSKFAGDINKVILDELNARWFTTMEDVQATDYPAGSRTSLKRQPQTVARAPPAPRGATAPLAPAR